MPILTAEERVGTLLAGRYRLESILGSGGTSVVYRASHAWTARSVAVKLLKPEHARDRGIVMRFLREARTASTLVHPNVVTILDMGTDPAGDVYLAMEHLTGSSLGAVLDREGALEVPRALELLRPIMDAIASAHARGIVHRDVKPDNVLVGDRGDGVTRSILLDFGMAKTTEAAWGHATQTGTIVGTPFYMSPEQAEGAADVGAASDVWSMGVLWYRCLGGALPFFGTSPTSLLLAIVRGDHVLLRERAPHVPEAIASVIERALRVERSERYPDMKAMIAALDRAIAGEVDPVGATEHLRGVSLATTPAAPLVATAKRSEPELSPPELSPPFLPSPRTSLGRAAALGIGGLVVIAAIAASAMLVGAGPDEVVAVVPPSPPAIEPAPAELGIEPESAERAIVPEPAIEPAPGAPASAAALGASEAATAVPEAPIEPAPIPTRPTAPAPRSGLASPASVPAIASPPADVRTAPRRRGLARSFDERDERPSTGLATEW